MSFPEILARLQEERHETNYMLAKTIGVHQSTIKNWKSGTKPQQRHIMRLIEHYKVTEEELKGWLEDGKRD